MARWEAEMFNEILQWAALVLMAIFVAVWFAVTHRLAREIGDAVKDQEERITIKIGAAIIAKEQMSKSFGTRCCHGFISNQKSKDAA